MQGRIPGVGEEVVFAEQDLDIAQAILDHLARVECEIVGFTASFAIDDHPVGDGDVVIHREAAPEIERDTTWAPVVAHQAALDQRRTANDAAGRGNAQRREKRHHQVERHRCRLTVGIDQQPAASHGAGVRRSLEFLDGDVQRIGDQARLPRTNRDVLARAAA